MSSSILKSSGDVQEFSAEKLAQSIVHAGGDQRVSTEVAAYVAKQRPATTAEIHKLVLKNLRRKYRPLAARYDLKRALLRFGPSGFPFEQYVGELLQAKGYSVKTGQFLQGQCVRHEVDVVAEKDQQRHLIECKFHNNLALKCDVKVALYIRARFDDLDAHWQSAKEPRSHVQHMWIVTNTEFTTDAIQYARCAGGIHLMGWASPQGEGLGHLIDETGLHPITALQSLSAKEATTLVRNGVVLCRDVAENPRALRQLGYRQRDISGLVREAQAVCQLEQQL